MAQLNTTNLETQIQSLINSVSTSTTVDDIMNSALAVGNFSSDRTNVINTSNELPNIFYDNIPDGVIYFIDDTKTYVISNRYRWLDIHGTLLIDDSPTTPSYSWGLNNTGQLGDDTTTARSSPVSVVGGFTDWCQVSSGSRHTAAVRTNGTLWAWGTNSSGQLGDNTTVSRSSPVGVVGGFTNWCQVSAGCQHTAAIRTNGTIWTWGRNAYGRLGDNTIINQSSPVSVVGGFADWCQVSAGGFHTAAIRTNGTIWTWGNNCRGQLGDNTTVSRSSPVSVVGGFTDWCQVSAGCQHTAAIRTNGTLWTWGNNSSGRLGDNTTADRSSPVSVIGGFTDWCQVSAGACHTAAVRTNGTLWTWGWNSSGQLGDNTTVSRSSPVSVVGGFTDWCQVSAGYAHTAAVRTNGSLWAWGSNNTGQLGDNTIIIRSSPVSVIGGFTDWCQVSASGSHTFGTRVF